MSFAHIKGHNAAVDAAEDIIVAGGTYVFLAAAETPTIESADTEDHLTDGTGAKTVVVEGLNSSHKAVAETVNMNGTTQVTLSTSFLRINRAYVKSAGAGSTNAGVIDIKDAASNILAKIPAGFGETLQCIYTVPDVIGNGILGGWEFAGVTSAADVTITMSLESRAPNESWLTHAYKVIKADDTAAHSAVFGSGIVIARKSDIRLRCLAVSATGQNITASFDIGF